MSLGGSIETISIFVPISIRSLIVLLNTVVQQFRLYSTKDNSQFIKSYFTESTPIL